MILVDSSVWIDLFADRDTLQTRTLEEMAIDGELIIVGDLILAEVLQGARNSHAFARTLSRLSEFDRITISNPIVAITAARNYQTLRGLGVTVRKTIDTLIATRCILDGIPLLYSDRDFDPFVEHLGLISAFDSARGVT